MAEWLKELALFDHLLHGLFKFLGETSVPGKKTDLEGRNVYQEKFMRSCMYICRSYNKVFVYR